MILQRFSENRVFCVNRVEGGWSPSSILIMIRTALGAPFLSNFAKVLEGSAILENFFDSLDPD